ncbi:cation transporter [Kineococcus sp. NUM-3379]
MCDGHAARPAPHDELHDVPHDARRDVLTRRVRLLVAATITWNVAEAAVALTAGVRASSSALVGFGLDSVVEVSSAAALAWQFSARDPGVRQARERRALRVIALSFFALAAWVAADAVRTLTGSGEADPSRTGIVLAALSLLVMPLLSTAQRRAGRELHSASAVADSRQTMLCTYLSAVLLVGLVLNAALGWSWADPVAALVIAGLAVQEGRAAWRGEGCCAPGAGTATGSAAAQASCCAGPQEATPPPADIAAPRPALTVKPLAAPGGTAGGGCANGCCAPAPTPAGAVPLPLEARHPR